LPIKIENAKPRSDPTTMDFQNYCPETQVDWTALQVGKEYFHCMAVGGDDFKKFVFARIQRIADCIFVIADEPSGLAFAVGDWIEREERGPRNRFWTSDTPIPPPRVSDETSRNASPPRCSREQPSIQ